MLVPPRTRVLLVEDHQVVRQGFRALLEAQPDFAVSGEAGDGAAALLLAERLRPDLVLLDLGLPGLNGLEVIHQLRARLPGCRVVVLSMHAEEAYVLQALRNGATAYVLKESPFTDVLQALREAAQGRRYLSAPLAERDLEQYLQRSVKASPDPYDTLTNREREVLLLAASGESNQEIAGRLMVSVRTVETHRPNLMRKLALHNHPELIHYAIRKGLVRMDEP